jgi:hypothetical protein
MNTPTKDKLHGEIMMHYTCIRDKEPKITFQKLAKKVGDRGCTVFTNAFTGRYNTVSVKRLASIAAALKTYREPVVFEKKPITQSVGHVMYDVTPQETLSFWETVFAMILAIGMWNTFLWLLISLFSWIL